jgi:hypothetical protein
MLQNGGKNAKKSSSGRKRQDKTENYFDREVSRKIDSRMRSGETRLSELLELCTKLYKSMCKKIYL